MWYLHLNSYGYVLSQVLTVAIVIYSMVMSKECFAVYYSVEIFVLFHLLIVIGDMLKSRKITAHKIAVRETWNYSSYSSFA